MKLTDRAVTTARARRGKRLELWDTDVRGLCLRVGDTGKTWFYRYRNAEGQQPRVRLGAYVSPEDAVSIERRAREAGEPAPKPLTLHNARQAARALRVQIDAGGDPANEKRARAAALKAQPIKTFADLADSYFVACEAGSYRPRKRTKRASTLAEERGLWRRHLRDELGDGSVEEITPGAVKKLLLGLLHEGKGTTSNRVRALVRQMLNYAVDEGRLESNPVARLNALADETARERVLTDAELRTLWRGLNHVSEMQAPNGDRLTVGRRVRIALMLSMLLLQRRSEIAGMREKDIDFDNAAWVIPGGMTKNGQQHFVPLPPKAMELIGDALALRDRDSEYVFPGRYKNLSLTPAALTSAMCDMRAGLGLADIRLHDLRRTGATIMASERLGVSPFVIGRVLNHISERGGAARVTVAHYALHSYAPEKRSALQAWEGLLLEIVGERPSDAKVVQLRGALK